MGYNIYPGIGTIIIGLLVIISTFVLPILALVLLYRFYRMIQNIDRNIDDINRKWDRRDDY